MAAKQRYSKAKRELHLNEVAKLICKGFNNCEIASQLGVTEGQVRYDAKIISKRWAEKYSAELNDYKLQLVETLMQTVHWALQEWQRSKMGFTRTTETLGDKDTCTVTKQNSYGDPRYLQVAQEGIAKICKILGLNAPAKVTPTNPDGSESAAFVIALPNKQSIEEWNNALEFNPTETEEVNEQPMNSAS